MKDRFQSIAAENWSSLRCHLSFSRMVMRLRREVLGQMMGRCLVMVMSVTVRVLIFHRDWQHVGKIAF